MFLAPVLIVLIDFTIKTLVYRRTFGIPLKNCDFGGGLFTKHEVIIKSKFCLIQLNPTFLNIDAYYEERSSQSLSLHSKVTTVSIFSLEPLCSHG